MKTQNQKLYKPLVYTYKLQVYTMESITKAEIKAVLTILKSPEIEYNANNLAKAINLTSMGTLKILKRLENEEILKSRKVGKANIYKININPYSTKYLSTLLERQANHQNPKIKRWITELKPLKANLIILFGSILIKPNPNDIDVLLITSQKGFSSLKKQIKEINQLNIKKIHPLYQTKEDLINNIKKEHPPILQAIKGIIVKGEEEFIKIYNDTC